MTKQVMNPKRLIVNLCTACGMSLVAPVLLYGILILVNGMSDGYTHMIMFTIRLLTTHAAMQILTGLLITVVLVPAMYLAVQDAFDDVPKEVKVKVGRRYRDLKKGWVRT